jgi:hypothetical protein
LVVPGELCGAESWPESSARWIGAITGDSLIGTSTLGLGCISRWKPRICS